MYRYRITKYNPKYRDSSGAYQKNEWTDYCDIGKYFDGEKLTYDQYIKIENSYINAIIYFIDCLQINSLKIVSLEKYFKTLNKSDDYTESMRELGNQIQLGQEVSKEKIPDLARLILRTILWAKLENESMYLHLSDEFYMFIGSIKFCEDAIRKIENSGLFVEEFISPWYKEFDEK